MIPNRLSPRLITGIAVALFFGIALYLRIYLPYDKVFSGDWVKFTSIDSYYHLRLIDNLTRNFPHFLAFDPYTYFPHGAPVGWTPFFDWFLGGIIMIAGLGAPSQHLIDVIGAYFPAVLGAVTVIPVYFIGKALFNRWAGIVAAGLIALLPGEFLGRSTLGFTDHHVVETMFTTIFFLFFILAIQAARHKQLSLEHIRHPAWAAIKTPLIYSLLAGIFLGVYLLSWVGGLLFVLIVTIYFVVQFIIDHLKNENTDYLGITGIVTLFVALIISLPFMPRTWFSSLFLPSMLIAILVPAVLTAISKIMTKKKIKRTYYPLSLVGLGLVGLAAFYIIDPGLFKSMTGMFRFFHPGATSLTISEVRPILFPTGSFSLSGVWGNFTTASFLSLIAIVVLVYLAVKRGNAEKNLLLVWSLLVLAATLGQRRFAYYLAVNAALLTGYLSILLYIAVRFTLDYFRSESTDYMAWQTLELSNFESLMKRPAEAPVKPSRKKDRKKARKKPEPTTKTSGRQVSIGVWAIVVVLLVFVPNIGPAINTAATGYTTPSDAWYKSLSWLKENSPEPMGSPEAYYELYERPPYGENYTYPATAYGIMAWWDYGHLITRIGHRIPVSNPFQQGVKNTARFFTAPDEATADGIMDELGAKYVVINDKAASVTSLFPEIVTWSEKGASEFFEVYYIPREVLDKWMVFYYPEYYRSMATRLYTFDGQAVTPKSTTVISYRESQAEDGTTYKVMTTLEKFDTYQEAEDYIASQATGNYRIVGTDPAVSPVPLEELARYKPSYSATSGFAAGKTEVKIFEYVK
jgi:dolichyl-diphosphooligosaccharide--protein glycosyltransferase